MAVSTIDSSGLTSPLTSGVTTNTVTSAAATALTLQSAGTTAVTIDTSQNVGIGSSTAAQKLSVAGASVYQMRIWDGATSTSSYDIGRSNVDGYFRFYGNQTGVIGYIWGGVDGERMRIDTSGRVNINTTSNPLPSNGAGRINMVVPNGDDGFNIKHEHTGNCINIWRTNGDGNVLNFYRSNSAPQVSVGNISINASATSYQTSSDYRLKENITPMTGALDKVLQLKPVNFKWKTDGKEGQGFIAHELQAVVPDCVGGTKDEVDADGNPKYQGIDTSFLVATLTSAIQELKAELDELKAKVNA